MIVSIPTKEQVLYAHLVMHQNRLRILRSLDKELQNTDWAKACEKEANEIARILKLIVQEPISYEKRIAEIQSISVKLAELKPDTRSWRERIAAKFKSKNK